jgi:hypothetical protein
MPERRSCNRDDDCAKAEQEAKERWETKWPDRRWPGVSPSFHCHDDECEECFGN